LSNRGLLVASLEAAVPIWAADLSRLPLRELLAEGPELARTIGETVEVLQFRRASEGAGEAFNALARAVAILSFLADGMRFCGVRFKSVHPDSDDRR
jgi:hypothetical protein